jgi:pyruvate carboxylase
MGLGQRWPEVARTYAEVNRAFGDIVKVTPSSKVVGDLALFLVSHGMTVHEFENLGPDHSVTIPNSVVEMIAGSLGEPEGGWPKKIQNVVLRGGKTQKGRPGTNLKPVDLEETGAILEKKLGHKPSRGDLMSYLMYPEIFLKYAKIRSAYGDVDVLPTPQFFYGMQRSEEITVDLEPGKTLVIKLLTIGEPHLEGYRTVFFELNGQPREVNIVDKSLKAATTTRTKADANIPGQVGAPIPGAITSIAAEVGQTVAKGDKLLVMEAMKMQTTVYAPVAGKVQQILVQVGNHVEPKDLLIVIE